MRLCVKVVTPPQYPNLRQATPVSLSLFVWKKQKK